MCLLSPCLVEDGQRAGCSAGGMVVEEFREEARALLSGFMVLGSNT